MKTKNQTPTPTPWKTSPRPMDDQGRKLWITSGSDEILVGRAYREADATLFAAAPDLLEAAKIAESVLQSGFLYCDTLVQKRQVDIAHRLLIAAIARAEGR